MGNDAKAARAVWFVARHGVQLRDEAIPEIGARDVEIETLFSAISHGTEMLVYRGQVDPSLEPDLPTLAGQFSYPMKYGYAAVGKVERVGREVTGLSVGDTAFALHPHQTRFVAPAGVVRRLPPRVDPEVGVFGASLETAVNVALDTPLDVGETAVVIGQGVVGLLVTAILSRRGAGRVIAVDPLPIRREAALRMGADRALSPSPDLPSVVREASRGRLADVAVEISGSPAALQTALDVTAVEGTVVCASWYGVKPVTLDLGSSFHRGRQRIVSSQVGSIRPELRARWDRDRRFEIVSDLLMTLPLASLITHRVCFECAPEAYRIVDDESESAIQVILTYDTDG